MRLAIVLVRNQRLILWRLEKNIHRFLQISAPRRWPPRHDRSPFTLATTSATCLYHNLERRGRRVPDHANLRPMMKAAESRPRGISMQPMKRHPTRSATSDRRSIPHCDSPPLHGGKRQLHRNCLLIAHSDLLRCV
jgi:hypothetical protein